MAAKLMACAARSQALRKYSVMHSHTTKPEFSTNHISNQFGANHVNDGDQTGEIWGWCRCCCCCQIGRSVTTHGDVVLVEDNVVGIASVVDPCDLLASLDGDSRGVEDESTRVSAQLHSGIGVGRQRQGQAADANYCGLSDLLHGRSIPGGLGLDLGTDSAGTHAEGHCDK